MCRKSVFAVLAIAAIFAFVCSRGIPAKGTRKELEKAFKARYGANTRIEWSNATNCVSRLEGRFATHHVVTDTVAAIRVVVGFLNENRGLLGARSADLRLRFVSQPNYEVGFDEYHEGVRVERAGTEVELLRDGTVLGVWNGYIPDIKVSMVPDISSTDAVSAAAQSYVPRGPDEAPSVELVIYPIRSDSAVACHLAWRVDYRWYTYFIDAVDGSQLARWQNFIEDDLGELR